MKIDPSDVSLDVHTLKEKRTIADSFGAILCNVKALDGKTYDYELRHGDEEKSMDFLYLFKREHKPRHTPWKEDKGFQTVYPGARRGFSLADKYVESISEDKPKETEVSYHWRVYKSEIGFLEIWEGNPPITGSSVTGTAKATSEN